MQLVSGTIWNLKPSRSNRFVFEELLDGALAWDSSGKIQAVGPAQLLRKQYPEAREEKYPNSIILPGFIDTHIHFPQMRRVGCHGESLLGWLNKYIFPEEIEMSKKTNVRQFAPLFFNELLLNGTTASMIFSSSDASTTELLFQAAERAGVTAVIGKVSMDRLAPKALLRSPKRDREESTELIKKWHGRHGRLFYALTPRFSPACSEKLMQTLGELHQQHPSLTVQTHFAENLEELQLVKKMFPSSKDYLHTYEQFGLIGARTVLAHGIYAKPRELERLANSKSHLAHCPTSNLFLGSGLFPLGAYQDKKINVSIGTDVGAGTSFSIWNTLAAAYQVQRLRKSDIGPTQLLEMATLAGARALGLEDQLGNFEVGKSADLQIINWSHHPILKARMESSQDAEDRFFACLFHFEKSILQAVFAGGRKITRQKVL